MEVIKIKPQGFCKGVMKAINIVNRVLNDETVKKPIYMLGNIVHNRNIVEAFKNKGIKILEGKPRLELLDDIEDGTVIFTAHGVSDQVREKAYKKGLNIIDATCKDVTNIHQIIKEKIDDGYQILFFGKENHPETEGIKTISNNIKVLDENINIEELKIDSEKILITSQTTMSYLDVVSLYRALKTKIPQLELLDEVCNATRVRQTVIIENKDGLDLLIVVGDPLSNNSKMLKEVAEKKANIKSIMVENVEGLKDFDFSIYNKVGVTAGASTPDAIVEEIIACLRCENRNFVSRLTDDDYLK